MVFKHVIIPEKRNNVLFKKMVDVEKRYMTNVALEYR